MPSNHKEAIETRARNPNGLQKPALTLDTKCIFYSLLNVVAISTQIIMHPVVRWPAKKHEHFRWLLFFRESVHAWVHEELCDARIKNKTKDSKRMRESKGEREKEQIRRKQAI